MKFRFNVNLSDQDYLDYNVFWAIKSPYGKKQILTLRVIIAALFAVIILLSLYGGSFSVGSFLGVIAYVIAFILVQVFLTRFFGWILKREIKKLKKNGKMGYSPLSVIEFFDNSFIETAEFNKTEQSYTAIERISIVDNKMIFIHINNVMSYILPLSCFESEEQYRSFLDFIKTKCANIDIY